jgi:hypothetical protein
LLGLPQQRLITLNLSIAISELAFSKLNTSLGNYPNAALF